MDSEAESGKLDLERHRFPTPASLASWPGKERREPDKGSRHYLILDELADQLREEIPRAAAGRSDLAVLDVGCGEKPYLPFFSGIASSYVGIDAVPSPSVDLVSPAEKLPIPDEHFDLLISTQVLEHVDDPGACLSEMFRVLGPGGTLLLSTHGTFLYHPDPPESQRDYWRWTHSGLVRQVEASGDWIEVRIRPQGEFVATLGYLLGQFLDEALCRLRIPPLRRFFMARYSALVEWLDARFPPNARFPSPGSLNANYLVIARKR